jgi:hypothetical protein
MNESKRRFSLPHRSRVAQRQQQRGAAQSFLVPNNGNNTKAWPERKQ